MRVEKGLIEGQEENQVAYYPRSQGKRKFQAIGVLIVATAAEMFGKAEICALHF